MEDRRSDAWREERRQQIAAALTRQRAKIDAPSPASLPAPSPEELLVCSPKCCSPRGA